MTETENLLQKQIKSKRELLPDGFEDIHKEPRILNAEYDAVKNNRWIENRTDILPNGTYRYKRENFDYFQSTDYVPLPVANNPAVALGELNREDSLFLAIGFDAKKSLWRTHAILNAAEYLSLKIEHPEISQAVARAVMAVICDKLVFGEAENE